jgi:predicted DNA-binding protein (MmcQ/YjbR family)
LDDLIESLRQRCVEKPGVTSRSDDRDEFGILEGYLDTFAKIYLDEPAPVLMIRCGDDLRNQLEASSSAVSVSERMRWETEGWTWTDVVLDGSIPAETLLNLIDHSYQLLYDQLDDAQHHRISMLERGLAPEEILSELIAFHGLEGRRPEIEGIARPAFLLRTERPDGPDLPLGRTKIGGEPDLLEGLEWPVYRDGKPLAFLAQVNLSDLPEGAERGGLPASGLLSFFSAWGWQVEDDADPQIPDGEPAPDWTRILYREDLGALRRHPVPDGVNSFPAAGAELVPIVCLPNDKGEPDVAGLGWDDETWERFSRVVSDHDAMCSQLLGDPARNLLLGYADYIQSFVEEVAARDLRLLFQLASDDNAQMCWGDGGFLYFWADPRDIASRDFTKIHTDYQCG